MRQRRFRSFAAFALALALCLTLAGPALAADDATASSIRLAKTEGTVSAANSAGRNISLVKNLRLFNGYHVVTEAKSYAWLNLDSAKLLKEDASSNVEVRKSGKKLEVLLRSGNLFFNVTEPLDDDETLNIRTSTTLTGVRGTCGWVEVVDRWNTNVYILEGEVECAVTDPVSGEEKLTTVSAGETATFTVIRGGSSAATNGVEISKKSCEVKDVPGYVLVDLAQDRTLCNDIRAASGLDILGDLSRSGDAAAEARRRQEAEEQETAARLASIAAAEQAQANNVEAAPNTADTGELNMVGTWGWRYDESSKTLYIGGSGDMRDYLSHGDIPWDKQRKEIESIVIGNGITSIGGDAFYGCSSLTSVTIPDSVTRIGGDSFFDCNNLPSVTIPNGVTSIGTNAFNHCSSLTSVTLPSSLTFINNSAFAFCPNLTDVYYGGSAEQWSAISIGEVGNDHLTNATIHCADPSSTPVTPDPAIPSDLTMVGTWGWKYDEGSKTLYIGGSGAMDDYYALSDIPWDKQRREIEFIVIDQGITRIGHHAFTACDSLTNVTIPASVTSIGDYAFQNTGLTNVTIPSGVTRIGNDAFWGCIDLTSVSIPASVTSIGDRAFWGCVTLTDVNYGGSEAQWNAIDINSTGNDHLTNATIHYNSN